MARTFRWQPIRFHRNRPAAGPVVEKLQHAASLTLKHQAGQIIKISLNTFAPAKSKAPFRSGLDEMNLR